MKDPYKILGIGRDATQEKIKKAYRRRARELHPDLDPQNPWAEDEFKDLSAAYDILSDPAKKARYDAGRASRAGPHQPDGHRAGPFGRFFRQRAAKGAGVRVPGANVSYSLKIGFLEAAHGGIRRVRMTHGQALDVRVPPGTQDGQVLRLKGQGMPGIDAGAGDALVEILVEPHPFFRREGDDIHIEVPVTLTEAVLGARIEVPTIDGPVTLNVPRGSNTGTVLRLKGKGVARGQAEKERGDQLVKLAVVLPDKPDKDLVEFLEKWGRKHAYDVRRTKS